MRTPRFELHIRPMFRLTDRDHMAFAFDLTDYDAVAANAADILERLEGDMPPPGASGPWPEEWIELFKRWIDSGKQRLELGTAAFTFAATASAATITATGSYPAAGYTGWLQLESETDTTKTYVLYVEPPDTAVAGDPETFRLRERYAATDTRTAFVRDSTGVKQLN
ncbi:MAG: hypothetical protein ACRDKY_01115 [Solirubrobacteraceae bacterium]